MSVTFAPANLKEDASTPIQILGVQDVLSSLGDLCGISVDWKTAADGTFSVLRDGKWAPFTRFEFSSLQGNLTRVQGDGGCEFLIASEATAAAMLKPVEAVLRATLHLLEVEKREELLLDELGTNWESLEALYEISTDILRSGNITDALKRLLFRLASVQEGLKAALFVTRQGLMEPLISTAPGVETLHPDQLGDIGKVMKNRQVVMLNGLSRAPDSHACWKAATHVAAAPIVSNQSCIGFVIVWREDKCFEFTLPFSRLLEAITYQASMLMESDRLNRRVRESDLLAKEIEIASSIQQTLLLANAPKDVPGMDIAACSVPSHYIDGDFHDFLQHPNGTVDVIVGDVMGKGIAAALLGAATKNQLLRSIANLAICQEHSAPRPVDIVQRAASRVAEQLVSLERFVTLCYARFDSVSKQLLFVDCGHTSTILNRKADENCTFLQGDDLPIGVMQRFTCQQHSLEYRPGDTFLFYSDGVTENRSLNGEFFGTERLAECLQNWSSLGPALLVEQIRKEAVRFKGSPRFSDDFTCIAVRIHLDPEKRSPLISISESFECDLRELARFREWLCESEDAAKRCLGEEEISRMELACTELFTNCAHHAQDALSTDSIAVECTVYQDHVTVQMRHKGPWFDPLSVPPPSFDGSKDSGFGTYIVLRSADEAAYEREPDGTNLTTLSFLRTLTRHIPCK